MDLRGEKDVNDRTFVKFFIFLFLEYFKRLRNHSVENLLFFLVKSVFF